MRLEIIGQSEDLREVHAFEQGFQLLYGCLKVDFGHSEVIKVFDEVNYSF